MNPTAGLAPTSTVTVTTLPFVGDLSIDPGVLAVTQTAVAILAILVVAAIVIRLAHVFVASTARALLNREKFEGTAPELTALELKKRQDTIEALAVNVIRFFVVMIAGLMILETGFKLDIAPAIAGLGIAGIAIGLGTQHLVRDYLNGALILIENQYAKGDVVKVAGITGTVADFTLRRTTLRDADGTVHTVPNGEISVASNLTRIFAIVNQDVRLVFGTSVATATEVIDGVGQSLAEDQAWSARILEAPHVAQVSDFGDYGLTLRVTARVPAAAQWDVAGELRARLLAAFDADGIELVNSHIAAIAPPPPSAKAASRQPR
jgi:moderate conductance mechanosensitive channel